MADKSFWERLGRGVGYGWKKAKDLGSQLEREAKGHAPPSEKLSELYVELGRIVWVQAERDGSVDLNSPGVEALLRAIRAEHSRATRHHANDES